MSLFSRIVKSAVKEAVKQAKKPAPAPKPARPATPRPAKPAAPKIVQNEPLPQERVAHARTLYKKHIHDYVVFDMETTGIDATRARIVEIAAFRVRGSQIVESFYTLVNPGVRIPQEVSVIHGITNDRVQDAPKTAAALKAFFAFCGDDILIAHNTDTLFGPILIREAGRAKVPFENKLADSRWIARIYFPDFDGYTLDDVCETIHYQLNPQRLAMDDARAVFAVVEAGRDAFHKNQNL